MRSSLPVTATAVVLLCGYASAAVDPSVAIEAMDTFLIRQIDWFEPNRAGQPPLKQTFGWDTRTLDFPPPELHPMPPSSTEPSAPDPCAEMAWRGDIYDQSLDAIWFTERARLDYANGRDPTANLTRAQGLLDAGILLGNQDPCSDHRLRAAYWANKPVTDGVSSIMAPDPATGNTAWFGIALTRFYYTAGSLGYLDATTRGTYLNAAKEKGQWILDNCAGSGSFGFTGGSGDWSQTPFTWKSTEHNIDAWTLGRNLYALTGESKWEAMAASAGSFVQSMYVEEGPSTGYYMTGTDDLGAPNTSPIPADAQAWTTLARGVDSAIDSNERAEKAMRWLLVNLKDGCESGGLPSKGVKFSDVGKNMQCEVTASSAFALLWLEYETAEAQGFLDLLDWIRVNAAPSYDGIIDGIGLVGTPCPEGAWTGYGLDAWYYKLLHTASSDWFGLTCLYVQEGDDWSNPLMPIPEPATLGLLALGGVAILGRGRHRWRR